MAPMVVVDWQSQAWFQKLKYISENLLFFTFQYFCMRKSYKIFIFWAHTGNQLL